MLDEMLSRALEHNPERPGKFEGEHPATVYFYDCFLNGDGEQTVSGWLVFDVTPKEKAALGLTKDHYAIYENESGFVLGEPASNTRRYHSTDVLCQCGWGILNCYVNDLPEACPVCGYVF